MNTINCFFDGACKGNPDGAMGFGAVIIDGDNVHEISHGVKAKIGNSNNVAEYLAFIEVLTYIKDNFDKNDKIIIQGDSTLVVKQMSGQWKIKEGSYVEHALFAKDLLEKIKYQIGKIGIGWIPRERNGHADRLSNEGAESVESSDVLYFL